jgi:hypothetical protein
MRYDPDHEPDRASWFGLSEGERIALVAEYHRRAGIKLPNQQAHAAMHVVVENQAMMGDETLVPKTLARLMGEGLDRHDAVHAIASVLSGVMFQDVKEECGDDIKAVYARQLAALTAEKWCARADEGTDP